MMKLSRVLLLTTGVVLATFVFANEPADVVKTMSPDGRKDVRIHFYIDGHKRNTDANMRKGNSQAYVRAINALRHVLTDRNNPIESGLRQRGIGKNTEVNTGTVFVLKPNGIVPFSLSNYAKESDFGKFGSEEGAWDRDELVKKVLANEKTGENIVVCVVSNDPSLSTKHGCFYLEEERGIMFFMLHAQRESVNGSWTHPNWSVDEWASFLREAMGVNANDIANAIVDNYYALSAAEETGLKAVICTPAEEVISLERVRSLPQKKMWKVSVTHNGVDLSCDKDVQAVAPTSGQNRVVVQALSPTGVAYTRTWEQDAFIYHALKDNEKLYADVTNVIKKAKEEGVSGKGFSELERYANDPSKPYNKTKIALLPKVVVEVNNENWVCS